MDTQKILTLLNSVENTQNLSESKTGHSHKDPISFLTNSIESSLCDHSDAYVLVTENITVARNISVPASFPAGIQPQRKQPLVAATQVAFKNCTPFKDGNTKINDTFADYANFINIAMPMYNFKLGLIRDEAADNVNVTDDVNAPSFKYEANLISNTEANGTKQGVNIAIPINYLNNFWRSLEMALINCKVELSLKWIENCVLTTAKIIADAELNEGFKRTVY